MSVPKRIAESEMQPAESQQMFWTVTAPAGTERADVLAPTFWVHVARKLRPLAEINVIAQDCSWYGKYLVLYAHGVDVKLAELGFWALAVDKTAELENDEFRVQWAGPSHLFRVIRKTDNVVVQKGIKTRNEAGIWMFRNSKAA